MPEVVPFSQHPESPNPNRVNWIAQTTDGTQIPNWSEIADARYGTIKHVAVVNEDGSVFDKVELDWKPAAFVVIYRINPRRDNVVEFLIPAERRVLLRDEEGKQGDVIIPNIPQGLIKLEAGETAEGAAKREVREETGYDIPSVTKLEDIYFDAANSSSPMPFFIAEVPFDQTQQAQQLDSDEQITAGESNWYSLEDSQRLRIQCAKTLSGLMLATGFLGLLQNEADNATSEHPKLPVIPRDLITIEQAAQLSDLSARTIRRLAGKGKIDSTMIGRSRVLLTTAKAVRNYMETDSNRKYDPHKKKRANLGS